MKKTIYMNDPLYRLNEQTSDGGFSRRLGEIVERYDIIMKLTPEPPAFSQAEMHILGEVLTGAKISTGFIHSLGFEIQDSVLETPEIREALAKKIDAMTAAEKVKMIDSLSPLQDRTASPSLNEPKAHRRWVVDAQKSDI